MHASSRGRTCEWRQAGDESAWGQASGRTGDAELLLERLELEAQDLLVDGERVQARLERGVLLRIRTSCVACARARAHCSV